METKFDNGEVVGMVEPSYFFPWKIGKSIPYFQKFGSIVIGYANPIAVIYPKNSDMPWAIRVPIFV